MRIHDPGAILLAGYLASLIGLNLIGGLISSFYQRKFEEPSPKAGFAASSIMLAAIIVLLAVERTGPGWIGPVNGILLACCAAASAWNSVSLFFTMKRIRK